MKTKILIFAVAVIAIAALIFGYVQMSKERTADTVADQPVTAPSRVQAGANGETVINLDPKTQQLVGLQTAPLAATTLPPEIKAYGRVLDSAASVLLHNDAVAARAALQASQPEYKRLKKLSAEDNASAHALETAEAQMKRDQGALDTAEAQLAAASGKAVLDEPSDFFQSLARQETVLVRLDLPAGESVAEAPTAAQLTLPGTEQTAAAIFLGRAATTDPQVQGAGFIFVVTNAPATLTPGLAVTGFLQLPGEPANGVIVPDAAVVRSNERIWIYVQTGDSAFARREIAPDHPANGGWFVTNGAAAGDKVVVIGAQTLLSEEHKTEIKMGD
jgi:hypothetical protein